MESKDFYNQAIKLMSDIKNIEPQLVSGSDSELCVLTTDKQTVYAGITSVKISNGQIMRACPEFNAIMTMIASGETAVEKLITISFSSKEVSQPCPECIKLLCDTNLDNKDTEIYVSPNQSSKASELCSSDTDSKKAESAPATGFEAVSEIVAPPPAMNQAPKSPLPSANDFVGFATDGEIGDFGFEAAETPEEDDEQNEFEDKIAANQDNPFYAPPTMQMPAPDIMQQQGHEQQAPYPQQPYGQPYPQPYGQPQYPQSPYGQQTGTPNSYYFNQPQQPYGQPQYQQYGQPNSYYYGQPQGQQSIYMQPQGQQSMYFNQPSNHSQTVSNYYGQVQPQQQSSYYSAQATPVAKKTETSAFKNRLANFIDDEAGTAPNPNINETATLSKAEMLKQAKERKKLAKMDAKKRGSHNN